MRIKEHRFAFNVDNETYLFTIEEFLSGIPPWPHKFRLQLPPFSSPPAITYYGASCYACVENAAAFLVRQLDQSGIGKNSLEGPSQHNLTWWKEDRKLPTQGADTHP
jgi:hypothetical protein